MISLCSDWEFTREWSAGFAHGEGRFPLVDLPHIALDQWPQGKQAVRCLYTGNGDRFGRVLHVVRDGNPHPDSVRTPEWCKKEQAISPEGETK